MNRFAIFSKQPLKRNVCRQRNETMNNSDDLVDKKEQESSLQTPLLEETERGGHVTPMSVSVDEEATPPSTADAAASSFSHQEDNDDGGGGGVATDPLLLVPSNEEGNETTTAADDDDALLMVPLRGQPQPPAFRDAWWAVLFYIQVMIILATAIMLGPLMMREKSSSPSSSYGHHTDLYAYEWVNENNYNNNVNKNNMYLLRFDKLLGLLLQLLALPLVAAMLSILAIYALLEKYSRPFVQASFWMTPVVFTLLAIINTLGIGVDHHDHDNNNSSTSNQSMQILGLWAVALMWTVLAICHFRFYRRSIPYAAANLKVALRALQSSRGGLLCCAITTQIVSKQRKCLRNFVFWIDWL